MSAKSKRSIVEIIGESGGGVGVVTSMRRKNERVRWEIGESLLGGRVSVEALVGGGVGQGPGALCSLYLQ